MTREQRLLEAAKMRAEHDEDCGDKDERFGPDETCECGAASLQHALAEYHAASAGDEGERCRRCEDMEHVAAPGLCPECAARAHAPNSYQKDRNNAQNPPEKQDVSRKVETMGPGDLEMVIARATGGKKTVEVPRSQGAEFPQPQDGDLLAKMGTDAKSWADAFVRMFTGHVVGSEKVDEGLMIGWFSNAIMAGHDRALASRPKADGRELTIKVRKAPEGGFAFLYEAVELNQFVNDGKIVEQDVRFREVGDV